MGMQAKTICKILNKKLTEWVATIKDESLAYEVKRDAIVTGGSICSMLLGEPVNDFDVYFKTKETAYRVAGYYCDEFIFNNKELKHKDTKPFLPTPRYENIVNCKGKVEERVIIYIKSAGVVAEGMDEYKYFEQEPEEAAEEFAESLMTQEDNTKPKYRPVFISQNAITLSDKMQIVIRFWGNPEEIHDNYDFVHATCYYDFQADKLVLKQEALESMMSKTLIYRGSLYPMASIFRTRKFLQRGWKISAGQQLKIMWQISELNLNEHEMLREQLTGVDQAYMYQLINALKDTDPAKINSAYVATIIDRIF